ncbi:MAG: hypothetical protein MJA83_10670, partial [Gammaproteobacteria bacterium]|nr:hypothetical protein [Gammaproteobacteria bacterium]
MKFIKKYGTFSVALLGALTGLLALYNDYSNTEFNKPFAIRAATAESFRGQIQSAESRNDVDEVNRLKHAYENYEEGWRNTNVLESLTLGFNNLTTLIASPENLARVHGILNGPSAAHVRQHAEPQALGNAYLAVGEYDQAITQFKIAAANHPED